VSFADASTGSPTGWQWDFQNDGTVDSTAQNPSFTYTTPGTYAVKLRATNAAGGDDELKTAYVTVNPAGGDPPPAGTLTPVADAHVKSSSPSTNYGSLDTLRLRNGGTTSDTYRSYLKFDVSGLSGAATSAKLRLFVTDPSPDGGSVFEVDDGWTESGLTWANAPAVGGSSLAGAGATTTGSWVEYDVTGAVTGNGPVSFAITTTSSNSQYATSREGVNKPQLVIGGDGSPPPPGPTAPTADFSATPTTGTAPLQVAFTDASTGSPTSWEWDFQNDGTVDSTAQNPSFTYSAPGTYAVKLTARNAGGADEELKLGYVTVGGGGPAGGTQTLTPVADAHVKSTSAMKNYGTLDHLRLRNGGTTSDTYRTYLKFDVSGLSGAPASAKLRLFATDGGPDGGSVFRAGNAWTETGLTWNNAPAVTGGSLASAGTVANGAWVDFDVTSAVTGNGEVTFQLTTTSSNSVYFTSREGADKPQLVLLDGSASVPTTASTFAARSVAPSLPETGAPGSLVGVSLVCPLEGSGQTKAA
jgi:PKD repeat protein